MKAINLRTLTVLVILGLSLPAFSQVTLRLASQSGCPGLVTVPLEAENFNNVSSLSLKFTFDTNILVYDTFTDLHTGLGSGIFLANCVKPQVILAWFSLNPASLGTTTLIKFQFHHILNEHTTLTWDDDSLGTCVLTDENGNPLTTQFVDATLNSGFIPPQPLNPTHQQVIFADHVQLHWNGSGCLPLYEVLYGRDLSFEADTTRISAIFGTSTPLNGLVFDTTYFWKVRAVKPGTPFVTAWSEVYSFSTVNPDAIPFSESPADALGIFPNPGAGRFTLFLSLAAPSSIRWQILSMTGQEVQPFRALENSTGLIEIPVNLEFVSQGQYFIQLEIRQAKGTITRTIPLLIE